VLHGKVLSRSYPMAGAPSLRMKILNTAVDTGGMDGATDNAFAWWHAMVKGDVGSGRPPLPPTAITLFKGGNNPKGKLLPPPTVDAKRQIKGAPQAELYVPNVHRIKDIADVRLKRVEDGPGFIGFPNDVDPAYLAELKAESLQNGLWVREPHRANETWDLYVISYTVVLRFGGNDSSFAWVPEWARPPKEAPRRLETAEQAMDEPEVQPSAAAARPVVSRAATASRRGKPRRGVRVVRGS
jgi:phage terminase large subunit GpA-like protein